MPLAVGKGKAGGVERRASVDGLVESSAASSVPTKSHPLLVFFQIYRRSGFAEFMETHAARGADYADAVSWLSYQLAPRAMIFRRDNGDVLDLASLKDTMRSNNWKHDPVRRGGAPACHGSGGGAHRLWGL
jgi:Phospholipase B